MGDRPKRPSPIFIAGTMTGIRTDLHTIVLPFGNRPQAGKIGVTHLTHVANGRG
jgi:hypothetical protein